VSITSVELPDLICRVATGTGKRVKKDYKQYIYPE